MKDMKKCFKCDNEKELSEFNFRKDTQTNRNQCRDCIKLINWEFRTMNRDEIKIRRKKYCENIKYKNLKRIYDIEYCERESRKDSALYEKLYSRK